MKQRFKRILLILAIPLLLGGIVHYTVSYKIKNILKLLVEKESENSYAFNASKIEVSFWNKNLIVENARLISTDTTAAKTHYNIEIPKMYLGIRSWSDILFNRKVAIDSCCIIDSKFGIHEKSIVQKDTSHANVNLKDIFASIEKTLLFLEIKSLTIQNTAFTYKNIHSKKVLSGSGINFSIQNLSKDNKDGHLLYSDDIQVNIKNQKWDLPDGIHSVSFKSLNFSGEDQFFELDSFTVHSEKKDDKGEINLFTEKFFFNSLDFSSMYEKNVLEIDTLLCIRPVLTIDVEHKNISKAKSNSTLSAQKKPSTTPQSLDKYLPELFKEKHFNYINIEDGQVLIKNKTNNNSNAIVQKSNLKIYNLSLKENRQPYLKTDSILFGLKDITFVTPDSTFQVVASELLVINNDLILRNSFFGPTESNSSKKSISFTAPEFRLTNINFFDLIQKKLNADKAELYNPKIVVKSGTHEEKQEPSVSGGIERFYASLHEFRELIGIEKLQITDGDVLIQTSNKQHAVIHMQGIDALVLPIHFMNSDSLVEIKHSMPEIKINTISIESDKVNVSIRNYTFDGIQRKNYADYIHLKMLNEIDIEGTKIYWEIFDWDLFQKYKRVDIKAFLAQTLSINIHTKEVEKTGKGTKKDLPDIRVGKLNVGQLTVHSVMAKDTLSFNARNVLVDSLRTVKQFFTWKIVDGIYENIHIQKENLTANIQLLKFNELTEVVIQHASVNKKENNTIINVKIPATTILGNFYSTDFSRMNIQKLYIENPSINYTSVTHGNEKNAPKKDFIVPINIVVKELMVTNAQINYKQIHASDTLSASGQCTITLKNIIAAKADDKIFQFDAFVLNVRQLHLVKNAFSIDVPVASIQSKHGALNSVRNNAIAFDCDLFVHWDGINFIKASEKNNASLRLENLSGSFVKNQFIFATDKAIAWQSVLHDLSIDKGSLSFLSDKSQLKINEITWQNKLNVLSFNNITYHPKLNLEDAIKNAPSQFDYLTLAGKSIKLKNINGGGNTSDSIIHIQNFMLDQFELSATRDKNVPRKNVKLKEMPTKIIQHIPWPIAIDSVIVVNSKVLVHQIEANTYKEAMIPIENINASITNISNRTSGKDSLSLTARANILDVAINSFTYTESYADSLSYFHASSNIVPGKFTDLNALTVPLASLSIDNGYSNNLTALWAGNKYAAIGQMNFIYKDLEVHLLNKTDTAQTTIALRIENTLANDIINKNNKKPSVIFFERNSEKQIFNYWLKATLQGVYSSVGIKSSDKYLKHYYKVKEKYHLP